MDNFEILNARVDVITRFTSQGENRDICFPCKMRYQGQNITFTEVGLRHPTAKGKRMLHVFDVTDGANDYRLEFDAENLTWRLVAILDGRNA